MTPTSCTGQKWLADAAKKFAEPPRTWSALPKGVSTESSATEPTTRRDIERRLIADGDEAMSCERCGPPSAPARRWRAPGGDRSGTADGDGAHMRSGAEMPSTASP